MKSSWQLTLHVRQSDAAFAVGPFEAVDAGKAGSRRLPARIIAPKGKRAHAKCAAGITATPSP